METIIFLMMIIYIGGAFASLHLYIQNINKKDKKGIKIKSYYPLTVLVICGIIYFLGSLLAIFYDGKKNGK
jgi:hypothetical protein